MKMIHLIRLKLIIPQQFPLSPKVQLIRGFLFFSQTFSQFWFQTRCFRLVLCSRDIAGPSTSIPLGPQTNETANSQVFAGIPTNGVHFIKRAIRRQFSVRCLYFRVFYAEFRAENVQEFSLY